MRRALLALAVAWTGLAGPAAAEGLPALSPQPAGVPWPTREWPTGTPVGVEPPTLRAAVDALFAPRDRHDRPETRALLVVQGGRLVVERYAEGFGPETRFHSWSVAKSVTQALLALRIRDGALSLAQPAPVAAWQGEGDPRAALTLEHLLHMNSGLGNDDRFEPGGNPAESFAARLLFGDGAADVVAFAAAPGLLHPPGSRWAYSTGTSMILARVVGDSLGGGPEGLSRFAQRELFAPIGAHSVRLEFDATGTFLGGGFVWARARDWARFGYLYLRDGRWEEHPLLPEGWVDYTRTKAPAENNGSYGAHFWLNHPPSEGQPPQLLPGGPRSAFAAVGNSGQYVTIVPTRDLVVVRLGELPDTTRWAELAASVAAVVAAFPALGPEQAAPPWPGQEASP